MLGWREGVAKQKKKLKAKKTAVGFATVSQYYVGSRALRIRTVGRIFVFALITA